MQFPVKWFDDFVLSCSFVPFFITSTVLFVACVGKTGPKASVVSDGESEKCLMWLN